VCVCERVCVRVCVYVIQGSLSLLHTYTQTEGLFVV